MSTIISAARSCLTRRFATSRARNAAFTTRSNILTISGGTCALLVSLVAVVPNSFAQYSGVEKFRKQWRQIDERAGHLEALDFQVLSHRDWARLGQSHAKNVVVHWPDGRRTKGLDDHIEQLKQLFLHAPDTRVRAHRAQFGSRDWTCFIVDLAGTFTRPMQITGGGKVPPSGRPFKITMCIVGHWNNRGLIDEEYLFWDNQSYMRQLGVTK